jgi:DNA-binding transcriptional ArsR family regulator
LTKKTKVDLDQFDMRLVKALRHPTRAYALTAMAHRAVSPKEIAAELGVDVNHAAYHVKALVKLDCAELVKMEKRRNADEHFYKATVQHFFDPEDWKQVPAHDRLKMRIDLIKEVSGEASVAAKAETLDTVDNHMSRTPMKVDKQGWRDLSTYLDEVLERVREIHEEAALRLSKSEEESIEARVALIQFELPKKSR